MPTERASSGKALLTAAMLGFSRASQLAPQDRRLFDPAEIQWSIDEHQPERLDHLPSYRGAISALSSKDLRGTGDLLKEYSSRLFWPDAEFASITYLNQGLPLYSDLFRAYELDVVDVSGRPLNHQLRLSSKILLPGTQSLADVERVTSPNVATSRAIIANFADEVRKAPELPPESVRAISAAFERRYDELAELLQMELTGIRHDISVLGQSLRENQRAITETVTHLGSRLDLREIVKDAPKRLAEDVVDDSIVAAAKAAATTVIRLLAAAIVGSQG